MDTTCLYSTAQASVNGLIIPQIKSTKHKVATPESGQVALMLLIAQAQGRDSQPGEVQIVLSVRCSTYTLSTRTCSESICIALPLPVSAVQIVK